MAYSRPWDVFANWLLGTRDADEIDDAVRDIGVDLHERLNTILVDVEADPWRLKALETATVMHWSQAHIDVSTAYSKPTVAVNRIRPSVVSEGFVAYFPINIPEGSTLKNLSAKILMNSPTATVQTALHRVDSLGVSSVVDSLDATDSLAVQDIAYPLVNATLGAGESFVFVVAILANAASASSAALYSIKYSAELVWSA